MHYSRYKIGDYVDAVSNLMRVATENRHIVSAMAEVGFSGQKLQEGSLLYDDFLSVVNKHEGVTRHKKLVNEQRNQLHRSLKKEYMRAVKIARIAFHDQPDLLASMSLDGERARIMDLWVMQVEKLARHLKGDGSSMAVLQGYGITPEFVVSLDQQRQRLVDLSEKKSSMEEELAALTRQKKTSMVKFQRWVSDYVKIARIRFESEPEQLRFLGL